MRRSQTWETCLVYLDDVIVMGATFGDHLQNLATVLDWFHTIKLKLNPKNGHFLSDQCHIWGIWYQKKAFLLML